MVPKLNPETFISAFALSKLLNMCPSSLYSAPLYKDACCITAKVYLNWNKHVLSCVKIELVVNWLEKLKVFALFSLVMTYLVFLKMSQPTLEIIVFNAMATFIPCAHCFHLSLNLQFLTSSVMTWRSKLPFSYIWQVLLYFRA